MRCSSILIFAISLIIISQVTAQSICSPCPCCDAGSIAATSSPIAEVDEPQTRSLLSKASSPTAVSEEPEIRSALSIDSGSKGEATQNVRSPLWWPSPQIPGNNQPFGIGNPATVMGQGSPGAWHGDISSGPSVQVQQSTSVIGPLNQAQIGVGFYPGMYPPWYPPWSFPPTFPPTPPPTLIFPTTPLDPDFQFRPPAGPEGFVPLGAINMNDYSAGQGVQVTIGRKGFFVQAYELSNKIFICYP